MDNAKQHWKILQELGSDLENRVRSFLVIGQKGEGVIVATKDGQGYWFGKMEFSKGETKTATIPTRLDVSGLVQMAQSYSHILLLNKRGEIYAMGKNDRGELGLETNDEKIHYSPQLISNLHKFISVRCGLMHNLALTEDGKVWVWGGNLSGEVGLPSSTRFLSILRQIPELNPHRVVAVECGGLHSLALTDQGEVYGWGTYGNDNKSSLHTPTRIPTPSPVKSMAAGLHHTLLLTRTGEVLAFGDNFLGQLGHLNDTRSSGSLVKVECLPLISQIASHFATDLSIAMSTDQRCFVWGGLGDRTPVFTSRELPPFYSTVDSPLSFFSHHRITPHSVPIPETPAGLSTRMCRIFDNPKTNDIQFVVEQRTIHAHRNILSNSSDYFARMFSEKWLAPVDPEDPIVRVTITDHSYQVFHTLLRFLYTDYLEIHFDLLPEVFELASQYLVPELQQLCISRMRTTITPATCCLYYPFTYRHSQLPELATFQQELVQFASINFLEVISTAAFKSMDAKLCKELTLSMASLSP